MNENGHAVPEGRSEGRLKTLVYFCRCGSNIASRVNENAALLKIECQRDVTSVKAVDLLCSEEGREFLRAEIEEQRPDRIVFAACSPREHENTFRKVLRDAGMNPYLMQMANIREHAAWVTEGIEEATEKAVRLVKAAVSRVQRHETLEEKEIEASPDVLVIGAGPAGMKAALSIAQSGRKAVLVEKTPAIGGMPVLYEEIFPNLECGSCMLEPLIDEVLHGEYSTRIELLTLSEVEEVLGYYGNFVVRIRKGSRYVDLDKCIGCAECLEPCPVQVRNSFNFGLDVTKAISFPFTGALPNAPSIDSSRCLRFLGEECSMCKESCPIEGAIVYQEEEEVIERKVGAILVAVGADLYDPLKLPNLGYGRIFGVYTSLEFERILSSNGPTEGQIKNMGGCEPSSICIVHCAGSLDPDHKEYCSGICCQSAFKYNHMIEKQLPGTKIYHLFKELVIPGKDEFSLHREAKENPNAEFIRYKDIGDISVDAPGERENIQVDYVDASGREGSFMTDMVVLCMAMVPPLSAEVLEERLGITRDEAGFFEELHGRLDSVQSRVRGIYLSGTCRSPMDIQKAMDQAMASAGYVLAGLVKGRKLEVKPIVASVVQDRCGACRICVSVCPFKAVEVDEASGKSFVNAVLCQGCGTCVAACPSGAIDGNQFTSDEVMAEIRGGLR
jgi:heterodisulfide reductase subunit A